MRENMGGREGRISQMKKEERGRLEREDWKGTRKEAMGEEMGV
jgi:hypothetical protein